MKSDFVKTRKEEFRVKLRQKKLETILNKKRFKKTAESIFENEKEGISNEEQVIHDELLKIKVETVKIVYLEKVLKKSLSVQYS